MNTVDGILSRNFQAEAETRGYIVVAPAAADGDLFFEDGARIFPEFLKMILADYKIQDREVPHRGAIQRRHRGIPRRSCQSSIFPLGHRVPPIHVGADAGQASGDLEDVRLHVCRRKRRLPLAP